MGGEYIYAEIKKIINNLKTKKLIYLPSKSGWWVDNPK
jgi:hypothetical protein